MNTFHNKNLNEDISEILKSDDIKLATDTCQGSDPDDILHVIEVNSRTYYYYQKYNRNNDYDLLLETIEKYKP